MQGIRLKTILGRDLKVGDTVLKGAFGLLRVAEIRAPKQGVDHFVTVFRSVSGAPLTTFIDADEEVALVTSGVLVW